MIKRNHLLLIITTLFHIFNNTHTNPQQAILRLKADLEAAQKQIAHLSEKLSRLHSSTSDSVHNELTWHQKNGTTYITLVQGNALPYQRFVNWQRSAVVNPANSSLAYGGLGEGAFIKAATGNAAWGSFTEKVRNYWRTKGWSDGAEAQGNAVITLAGNLGTERYAGYIIHAVGPCGGTTEDRKPILKNTFESILKFADMKPSNPLLITCLGEQPGWGLEAIAISLVGLGSWVGDEGLAVEARLVVNYVIDYAKQLTQTNMREIRFITYTQEEYGLFEAALKKSISDKKITAVTNPTEVEPYLWQQLQKSGIRTPRKDRYSPALVFTINK